MSALEYDIRHFPFSRYGAMVAVSRDPVKDELVLHDARAHDGQDRALRLVFSDRPFASAAGADLKECAGIPFASTGTAAKLFITAADGKAELVISGDHRIHIHAKNLYLLLTTCRDNETTGCMIDAKRFEYVCPGACRYNRIDVEIGKMTATGPVVMQFGKYPVERTNSVLLSPENGAIDMEV